MSTKPRLIVVVGATGSGKTDLSIRLAQHYGAPVLSTDSRQIYRGLPIGTAQPDQAQLQAAEHHFIASHEITQDFNCGEYEVQALALLERLFATHDTVIAVGGSGLYVRALCEGMDDLPQADVQLRAQLAGRMEREGVASLAEELRRLDPEYYEQVDRSNPARVQRALEVCLQTGKPYSQQRLGVRRERPFDIVKVGVDMPREVLYERIDRRVDAMMEAGLEQEARAVYPFRHLNSLQTVGYKELFEWFDGAISREQAVELIKRNTRRYAKRQLTWFRRDAEIGWFAPDDLDGIVEYADSHGAGGEVVRH
ncbi:MAG: tRNA (adenosine(37)-N6)-dimethylallyltransferase MiaA [Alistipes sp.]|nr:tRNA (adenosine(37)-N6)-dimethylallyltransferase MiaA [Alistipes sp.]